MSQPIYTVTQVDNFIKQIFDAEELLHGIRIDGEVSGYSVKSDNAYFTLKDNCAQLSCCCFKISKTFSPKEGDKVIVTGRPDFYAKTGKLSFIVSKIEINGVGKLFQEFLELKNRLTEEGLFSVENKIAIPPLVKKLCIVTSSQGAVVQDILSTILKTTECLDISVVDVRVQGIGAVESILNALLIADNEGFDAIILARGGGSFEDLMPFNTEILARAVACLKTPVISAIGHETDFSLTDFAADERALTPTAAAERIIDGWKTLKYDLKNLKMRLSRASDIAIQSAQNSVISKSERLKMFIERIVEKKGIELQLLLLRLQSLSPSAVLKKGFIVAEKDGDRVTSIKNIKNGDIIKLLLEDGIALAKIELTEGL